MKLQLSAVLALGVLSSGFASTTAAPVEAKGSTKPATKPQPIINRWYKFRVTPAVGFPLGYENAKTHRSTETPLKGVKWDQIGYNDWSSGRETHVSMIVQVKPHRAQTFAGYRKEVAGAMGLASGMTGGKFKPGVFLRDNVMIGNAKGYQLVYDTNPGKAETMRLRSNTVYANGYAYNFFLSADDVKSYKKYEPAFNKLVASFKLLK